VYEKQQAFGFESIRILTMLRPFESGGKDDVYQGSQHSRHPNLLRR